MCKNNLLVLVGLMYGLALQAQEAPNVVLLFVDDLGWTSLGYQDERLHTPNIDRLKGEGLYFERTYIPTPTCSPSRVSLLTGKEAARVGFYRHILDGDKQNIKADGSRDTFNLWKNDPLQLPSRNWLPLEEVTYAEELKKHGYHNAFIGKWHVGHEPYHPVHQGFDSQYGTGNHGHPGSYIAPFFKKTDELKEIEKGRYLTDVLTDEATRFISEYDLPQPFMLSFWYYTVHSPFIGRPDLVNRYKSKGMEGRYAEFASMVSALDESVGRILQSIDDKEIRDNTVVVFMSDQGGYFDNAPLAGGKIGGNTLGEGGARVPFFIRYPGVTQPGTTTSIPVQSVDLFPTLVEIASGKKYRNKDIQGSSLMPLLKGKKAKKRKLYFFRSYEDQRSAVIEGDWKLVRYHSGKLELFNIAEDLSEERNLVNSQLKKAKKLKRALARWEAEVNVR